VEEVTRITRCSIETRKINRYANFRLNSLRSLAPGINCLHSMTYPVLAAYINVARAKFFGTTDWFPG
jgi:hypothetical protein